MCCFLIFLRCSHSRCVQGSREEDDLFGSSCFRCWTVVLCPHHLLPQGSCHPLAVLRPTWLALMLPGESDTSCTFSWGNLTFYHDTRLDPWQVLGHMCTSQGPGHDVISYWWTRTGADFIQLSKKEQCVIWWCVLCSTKPSDLLLSHLYDVRCRTAQGCIHITEKPHTTYCLFFKKKKKLPVRPKFIPKLRENLK